VEKEKYGDKLLQVAERNWIQNRSRWAFQKRGWREDTEKGDW